MSILVVMQNSHGQWNPVSFEALSAGVLLADKLGLPLVAAVLGSGIQPLTKELTKYDLDAIFSLDHPLLAEYTPEGYTEALAQLIRENTPLIVVFPHTYQVRDFAPRLSARFGSSLIGDVIRIEAGGLPILFTRQMHLGKLNADFTTDTEPAFVSVQANAFAPLLPESSTRPNATIEVVNVAIDPQQIYSRAEPPVKGTAQAVDLSTAKTIVSIGRGLKQKEDLALVQSLALELGAELTASRPLCDAGWLPMDRLIGTSGQTVSPDVYFAIGISGAIQHLLGIRGAKTVVAINQDETAPIFDIAQYGIVGDLNAVVPALVDELRKRKS